MAGQKVVQDERPFLSVLVPSYYSGKTLPETLDSIGADLSQMAADRVR